MFDQFITASEAARGANVPLTQILRAVADGKLTPAGRAGASRNSAVLFLASDQPIITAVMSGAAVASAGKPHVCGSLTEIEAKAAALRRAAAEGAE